MTTPPTEGVADVILRARGVRVGYEPGREILHGVDLEVRFGERLALVGPSGCGKSTLLKVLCGLLEPWEGSVELFGEPLWELDGRQRAELLRRIGVVFQHGGLLGSLTLGENLALARSRWDRLPYEPLAALARSRLAQVGLAGTEHLRPAELSGGMLRRAAVARALMCDPELLLCDEPTAGLDPTAAAGVDALLASLPHLTGATLLVVSHDLASIRTVASRVVFMEAGRILLEGAWEELAGSEYPQVRRFFARMAREGGRTSETFGTLLFSRGASGTGGLQQP